MAAPCQPILTADRLLLRPFRATDAAAVERQCADPRIALMVSRMPHPYPAGEAARWIADHEALRAADAEHVFCIDQAGAPVGAVSLRRGADGPVLGYWIAVSHWGRGLATEAARRVLGYAFETLDAPRVRAGHYADNPASGRVLAKCGFRYTHTDRQWCRGRGRDVACLRYVRAAPAAEAA